MKLITKKTLLYTLLFACVLVSTTLMSIFITNTIIEKNVVNAEEYSPPETKNVYEVTSIDDASEIAGFPGAIVSNTSLKISELQHKIYVLVKEDNEKAIFQIWGTTGKAPFLWLVQDPKIDGLASGKPFFYGNISGEIYYREGQNGESNRIELFWEKDGMPYYLFGNIDETFSKNSVIVMADSITIK